MDIAVLCESMMLIIFGCSWPANIHKSLTSKTTLGKSLVFEVLVVIGYLFGITAKIIILFTTYNSPMKGSWFLCPSCSDGMAWPEVSG